MNNQLPASYSTNLLIMEHLNALHSAQESFMKAESSAKLRNTLRKETRHTREHFDFGQAVYYKHNNDIQWKGHGKMSRWLSSIYKTWRFSYKGSLLQNSNC